MICNQCPRKCNIDRDSAVGFCKSAEAFRLSRAALHFWEEPCISGKNGSGTVFFSGCNLKCVYCQNYEISHENKGLEVSDERLIEIFERLIRDGAENINLVNPTHYAIQLLRVFKKWKSPVPIVYNSSGYEDIETLRLIKDFVDIYLVDFKYISPEKAKKYSAAADYPSVVKEALKEMCIQQSEDIFDEHGMMKKGVIIRHLVLPSNTNSSVKILEYLSESYPDRYISLMAQYTPCGDLSGCQEIDRRITKREYDKVLDKALSLGLDKVFTQELSSSQKKFIPAFDFTGIMW